PLPVPCAAGGAALLSAGRPASGVTSAEGSFRPAWPTLAACAAVGAADTSGGAIARRKRGSFFMVLLRGGKEEAHPDGGGQIVDPHHLRGELLPEDVVADVEADGPGVTEEKLEAEAAVAGEILGERRVDEAAARGEKEIE